MSDLPPKRLAELERLCDGATPGPWEVGGPYPGTAVIVLVDAGRGFPEPEPPVYDAIAILDSRTEGEPCPVARANAAFIAATDPATVRALVAGYRERDEAVRIMRAAQDCSMENAHGKFLAEQRAGAADEWQMRAAEAEKSVHDMQQHIDLARQRAEAAERTCQSLVEWDKANPKGRIYPIGKNDVEKQLDRIVEKAKDALSAPAGGTGGGG